MLSVVLCFTIFLSLFATTDVYAATKVASNNTVAGAGFRGYLIQDSKTQTSIIFHGTTQDGPLIQFKTDSGGLYVTKVDKYYRLYVGGFGYSVNEGVMDNGTLVSVNEHAFFNINGIKHYFSSYSSIIFQGTGTDNVGMGFDFEGNVQGRLNSGLSWTFGVSNVSIDLQLYELTDSEVADLAAQDKINQSVQQGNKLQEEANQTGKGILGKITDFFGSFFENIINALKSLFIPEDGYFSDFFTRLNDFFSEKLGFLYEPIDLFFNLLNAIKNASVGASPGLTFPEVKWDDTVIMPETKVDFSIVNKNMPELQEKIYFVTDIIMVGAVLWLLERKIDEVMHR